MTSISRFRLLAAASFISLLAGACETGGVGDPCVPEDEYVSDFSGFAIDEVDVEMRSLQCETRLCLVNHFQGRVSCPYGQDDARAKSDPRCKIPGTNEPITAAVAPQIAGRRADDAVYCSCRCDGPEENARYCTCPSGFACQELVPKLGFGPEQLTGSYCVREGTIYDKDTTDVHEVCDPARANCEE